jgi:hypothetical protein
VPISATLIYGETEAVLADTPLMAKAGNEVLDWVMVSGKDPKFITSEWEYFLKSFRTLSVIATKENGGLNDQEACPGTERIGFGGSCFRRIFRLSLLGPKG